MNEGVHQGMMRTAWLKLPEIVKFSRKIPSFLQHSDTNFFPAFLIDRSSIGCKNLHRSCFSVDEFFLNLEDAYGRNDVVSELVFR